MSFVPGVRPPETVSARAMWFVVGSGGGLWVKAERAGVALPSHDDVVELGLGRSAAHYLGRVHGEDCFALDAEQLDAGEPWQLRGLRALYGQLDDEAFAVAGRAVQVVAFAATHRFCGRCGQSTTRAELERALRCVSCSLTVYPRIAPAIIVLVRRGEQALLARAARFTSGFYSTLAGFVEPGESLEQTLEREVREEVGIEVKNIRYFGSQPWPFPHSLMVGFNADYAGGQLTADGVEIVDARWFDAAALPPIPPKPSIARRLIDAWISEVTGSSLD